MDTWSPEPSGENATNVSEIVSATIKKEKILYDLNIPISAFNFSHTYFVSGYHEYLNGPDGLTDSPECELKKEH